MTTLVTLSTKDAVVLGCDSLATSTRLLVDPLALVDYFDSTDGFSLKKGDDGAPLLTGLGEIFDRAENVPYDHMTDMDKLVDLSPLPMGFMFTGVTSIGSRTIKSLLAEFKEADAAFSTRPAPTNFTVKSVAKRLLDHLGHFYDAEYGDLDDRIKPHLEFLLAGYDKANHLPRVRRGVLHPRQNEECHSPGVAFAGMMQEIQRVVFGIDDENIFRLESRYLELLKEYVDKVRAVNGKDVQIPDVRQFVRDGFHLFGLQAPDQTGSPHFEIPGLTARWGDFSDQNAIDCVAWFIGIMREAHRFSSKMPTVGGPIHIALITREAGFRFISREEYRHEDHRVQRVQPRAQG